MNKSLLFKDSILKTIDVTQGTCQKTQREGERVYTN